MDSIFDFIFDEQTCPFDAASLNMIRVPDLTSRQPAPTQPVPSALSLLSIDDKCSPPNDINMEEEEEEVVAEHQPRPKTHPVVAPHARAMLLALIKEYLSEGIAFKQFIQKLKLCLCEEYDSNGVFEWVLRSILESGHTTRMSTYLEENGVSKEEIEVAIIHTTADEGSDNEFDIGEKRKRRDRKRVSISRGLRSPPNKWSKEESQRLIRLVFEFGDKSWKKIAEQLGGGKSGAQCAQHWKRVLSPEIRKGSWDDQEEALLFSLVSKHGQSWKNIAAEIKTRTDIQCRYQYQKACLSRQCDWLAQEDLLLKKKVALCLQERRNIIWTDVCKFVARAKLTKIPRTALECKERWSLLSSGTATTLNSLSSTLVYSNAPSYSPAIASAAPATTQSSLSSPVVEKKSTNSVPITTSAAILVC